MGLRADGLGTAFRGLAAFAPSHLAAAFSAPFANFLDLDVLPAIVFTPGLRCDRNLDLLARRHQVLLQEMRSAPR